MGKVWAWLKKYWKWLLFPIGIIGALVAFAAGRSGRPTRPATPVPNLDPPIDALHETQEADRRRDEQLHKLEAEHQTRLEQLTDDQRKELEALKTAPIEEVTAWFNSLQ